MRIKELLEQTVAPQPPGLGSTLPTTQPTEGPPNTSNTPNLTQTQSTATASQTALPPQTASTGMSKNDFDSLKNQITTLQAMMAKQMQLQQQSNKPGQS